MKRIKTSSERIFAVKSKWVDEEPISAELFSVERLEQYALTLAANGKIIAHHERRRLLLPRFEENGKRLAEAYRVLAVAVFEGQVVSPAAEWLLDNFHIVEEQLRQIREDLPKSYYKELPKLSLGELRGYPRIYEIALTFTAHTDSRFDCDSLRRFIRAYQQVTPLTIGELWAVAITLRLALIENLRRLANRVVAHRAERAEADALADKLLTATDEEQRTVVATIIQQLEKRKEISRAFVVQLTQRLRDQDPDVMPLVEWIEREVQTRDHSIEQLVQLEHHRQATAQVTVGNIITSMRLLSMLDWPDFIESVSLIEPILGQDPAGVYAQMDFATRDRYRHIIESIARRTSANELEVARQALALAQESKLRVPQDLARMHVGYYLIDDGLNKLEQKFDYHPPLGKRIQRAALARPNLFYFGIFSLLTGLILSLLCSLAASAGANLFDLIATAVLALIPATDLAVNILNWDVTHTFKPRVLPKMDANIAIPPAARTMIVIPTMLTSEAVVNELVEKLEVHYLANQDPEFYFALLTDFADASAEEMPNDEILLATALAGIEKLNDRYVPKSEDETPAINRFYIFHRCRQWNESEEKWIGWERKRGKLEEFNRLLRGARNTSFVVADAKQKLLASIHYVITLDSDTQLPRDAARKLIATIRHPLNGAQVDPVTRSVMRGYSILQPRVSVTLESSARSLFARILSGNTGVDPYSTAASDVYQDLFAEGSFTGKGLYDVDAFQTVLDNRVPENSLLSHDLFEGVFARVALVSDIELLDDYPAHYDTWAKRQHRWTRGDWQIARWLLPYVPNGTGKIERNTLSLISRWKIFDNLRRSLVAPGLILWLLAAWTILPGSPWWWTLFTIVAISFPVYAHVTTSLLSHPRGLPWTSYFWHVWSDFGTNTKQVGLMLTFLPHQAWLMVDAIARVAYRKLISGKNLLEWVTAAQTERHRRRDRAAFLHLIYPVMFFAVLVAGIVLVLRPSAFWLCLPFLLAWALSPFLAYTISRKISSSKESSRNFTAEDQQAWRLIARRTWSYFEAFVSTEDHWLPPDNFQEEPYPLIAHRTSPTNIGLLLLSTIAARDFGYLGLLETVERLELTFTTMKALEKFQGHFFNWYDTRTLKPLLPQYLSTVDSGNLAAHLIAVKQAALELSDQKLFDENLLRGLADTVLLLQTEVKRISAIKGRTQVVTIKQLHRELDICDQLIKAMKGNIDDAGLWAKFFAELLARAGEAEDIAHALEQEQGAESAESFAEFHRWIALLLNQTRAARRDFDMLIPWEVALISHLTPLIENHAPQALERWQKIVKLFSHVPAIGEIAEHCALALDEITALSTELAALETSERAAPSRGLAPLSALVVRVSLAATQLQQRTTAIAHTCDEMVEAMDFRFLFDEERKLFVIGYDVSNGRRDHSYYDLLASESRLTSLVAIAKGDAPQEHWFRLGRKITQVDRSGRALVSWTATMFEYLMPLLVTRDYAETLLDQTYQTIVARQISYGREQGVPWGISESAYNARDLHFNYQYGPFGVPGLGLKRGLSQDLVISPYATALAAMVMPEAALENMQRLAQLGALARYGFYEAIDYTPERLPQNQKHIIIKSFMGHHQGMSLIALDNILHGDVMHQRFHADPLIQATELLLQERIPQGVSPVRLRAEEVLMGPVVNTLNTPLGISFDSPNLPTPRTQLLSNGVYSVMITSAGAGSSTCGNPSEPRWAVTRWREDATRDNWGSFCYVRDVRTGALWSTGYQPTTRAPQKYDVTFMEDRAIFERLDAGILTKMEIVISPEDNAEVRYVTVTNRSPRVREIELTSYAEIVLTTPATDVAHPAFSNLSIETEFIREENALIARRRPRSPHDPTVYAVHTIVTEGETIGAVQYETSRQRFLGRGHDTRAPLAVTEDRPLSNTVGTVLDPIFSLRQRVRLKPNESAHVTFSTAVAHSREHILMLADKYHDPNIYERVERLAWTKAQIEMRHLNIDAREAHLFQRLAGRVLYSDNSLRPRSAVLARNNQTQAALWKFGISGDLPIILVRILQGDDLEIVRQILRGHEYLRLKGLPIDLVILNEHPPSYLQSLQDEIQMLIRSTGMQTLQDKPGGVFLRRADIISEQDKLLLQTVARVEFIAGRGALKEELASRPTEDSSPPTPFVPRLPARTYPEAPATGISDLQFFNGLGGFAWEGSEYVTILNEGQWTPAPWTNVIANAGDFGFQVTETGAGYTWSVNSRENRLTPWSNDAVSDPPGESIYLRDEETGTTWTPTPLPIRESQAYVVRHGQGYSTFEHNSHGIVQELTMFVPREASVKIMQLRLHNRTDRRRRLSVTTYNELVLGVTREKSSPFIVTGFDETSKAIFARNAYNNEFANRLVFTTMNPPPISATADRKSFLGRNGNTAQPSALRRAKLNENYGAGLDPCAALQSVIELAPDETREVIILLGESDTVETARQIIARYSQSTAVNEALEQVVNGWDETLSTIEVNTPDAAMNLMLNRWLPYQTLACRVWARSAFYQSGGAYGFRDQLQDVMALVYAKPEISRAQILRAAAHQFKEGDVQHWWHPPTDRGVRTRITDDLLWLPYVTSFYIRVTGDKAILDEVIPFLEAPLLAEGEDDSYLQPQVSTEQGTLYEHCLRAIDRSLVTGDHGLPLMGAGDWNDGMNRVGTGGKGESVWLAWFLYSTLENFAPFCAARQEQERADQYREHMAKLKTALEKNAWDGDWYVRAYFDDGTPLGSARNDECRIDSIAQSWGVISGAADKDRVARAMAAVEEHLVLQGDGLVLLFTPPFDHGTHDPGYIKGYVPGVRENGGQYTHAALWTLIAYAQLGDGDRAGELFALLNPINHSSTRAGLHKYRVEPYVAAGDVYAVPPHTGRGGWTWYTGSASWMYRAGLESILGFQLSGDRLRLNPCIPRDWREFEINYRHHQTQYNIRVENPHGVCRGVASLVIDGETQATSEIPLSDDGQLHRVTVILGTPEI